MKIGGVEDIGSEFVKFLWGPLSSDVDRGMVNNYSIVVCTCVILLDDDYLLVNPGGVDNKFVNHCNIR